MPDEQRLITDDMLLSQLTVGEFKTLLSHLLQDMVLPAQKTTVALDEAQITVRRKSLDEFMQDLSGD